MAKRLLGPRWEQSVKARNQMDLSTKSLISMADYKVMAAAREQEIQE